ncbi:MAG: DUF882 domain-containing protein [Shewanella sp.]|nr:DUF882 domain-containing protein [Shewanella sp.]
MSFLVGRNLAVLVLALVLVGCSLSPRITWHDTSWCTPWSMKYVLNRVATRFGSVSIHSTHRWPLENWRKGGKKRSYHLTCRAVDFSVRGEPKNVIRFLKSLPQVGGYSYYKKGFYHIDNGPRRTW